MKAGSVDKHPIRSLMISLTVGNGLFTLALFLLLSALALVPTNHLDSSTLYFYPFVAGAGALFGLERWWYHESGGVNPFHDK